MEGDSLAKLAGDLRTIKGRETGLDADALFKTVKGLVHEINEWAARLDALRERVLKCQTDEYEYLDAKMRSIAGAVSVGETTPE